MRTKPRESHHGGPIALWRARRERGRIRSKLPATQCSTENRRRSAPSPETLEQPDRRVVSGRIVQSSPRPLPISQCAPPGSYAVLGTEQAAGGVPGNGSTSARCRNMLRAGRRDDPSRSIEPNGAPKVMRRKSLSRREPAASLLSTEKLRPHSTVRSGSSRELWREAGARRYPMRPHQPLSLLVFREQASQHDGHLRPVGCSHKSSRSG
jgi:hypothetical protein